MSAGDQMIGSADLAVISSGGPGSVSGQPIELNAQH